MKLTTYSADKSRQVADLFTDVFSDSEGPQEGQLIGGLVEELTGGTEPGDLLGYICIQDDTIVGSIFFSRVTLASAKNAFILSPVAIASGQQGKGIGQQLINYGIQQLRSLGVELVFTYGDPKFYAKVGFGQISEDVVKAPAKLTYPHGWLAQSLNGEEIAPERGVTRCVPALDKQEYW